MRHRFEFEAADIALVKELLARMSDHWLVRQRYDLNLASEKPPITRERFWHVMIGCLLTSQQASGENDPVMRFFDLNPFPLRFDICELGSIRELTATTLKDFGGIRYYGNISNATFETMSGGRPMG